MRKNIVSVGLLVSLLSVGVLTSNVREERNTLEVRDVLVEDFTNEASGRLVRRANEVAENNLSDVKAQISSVNENGTRHIRFVAALDSYLYENVAFTITANNGEETRTLVNNEVVTTAYTHLVAAGETLSASDAFGEGYTYLVAYTINNVPESAWGFSFSATVSARAEGYSEDVVSSATRVISDMAANEDEMTPVERVDPEITFNFTPGTTYTIGAEEKPTATVSEGADYVVTYSSDTTGYNSTEYPTVAGTYSIVVTVNQNDQYNYKKAHQWFRLVEPKLTPEVTISIENGATLTIGGNEPTVTVSEGVEYITYYELDGVRYSDTLPTEPGTYSFIVETIENDEYNSARQWRWFRLVEEPTA